jgi:patatin-related protein
MHGITKEIQKLVAASKAYAEDQSVCHFEESDTEWAYWHALKRREGDTGVRARVVVDVIAGTSAGGINGIILAKALAHDLPQDSLRDVWLDRGDIKKLMAPRMARMVPFLPLKLAAWAAGGALRGRLDPPLDGNRMFCWIRDALDEMDSGGRGGTLMPDEHALELYVTLTDFSGYYRGVPMDDPKQVKDRRHRHVLTFAYTNGRDQLSQDWNPALAFAARATSCFPGAFPPINLANIDLNAPGWDGLSRFKDDCWSIYSLSGEDVAKRHFVDGGVLDNFPFRHAIDAVRMRPAALEVDRKLIYIEPHPAPRRTPPDGTPPKLVATVAGGLSALPRHEPILDDLLAVRAFNERVERAADVIEVAHETIKGRVLPRLDAVGYAEANTEAIEAATDDLSYAMYLELKLHSVVDGFAALASEVCHFPSDSNHAFFVHDALVQWARANGLLTPAMTPTEEQIKFLSVFDLPYAERRLRFVVRQLSSLFDGDVVPRAEVNKAKELVYKEIAALRRATADAGAGSRGDAVRRVFDADRLGRLIESESSPDETIRCFVHEASDDIERLRTGLAEFLNHELRDFGERGFKVLDTATKGWDPATRRDVLAHYAGFPLWDVVIFPISAVADVGELNRIEIVRFSPEDVSLLKTPGQKGRRPTTQEKLKGVAAGHFAAFFSRDRRENDYLWGRLDAAERLIGLVLGERPEDLCHSAFAAVLDQEEPRLKEVRELTRHLRGQVSGPP